MTQRFATMQDIQNLRGEFDSFRGEMVRSVSASDLAIKKLMASMRDELVDEIRNVKDTLTDPAKWAETTAVRQLREERMSALTARAKRAEKSKKVWIAMAGAITILSPAIARLLDAIASWILHR